MLLATIITTCSINAPCTPDKTCRYIGSPHITCILSPFTDLPFWKPLFVTIKDNTQEESWSLSWRRSMDIIFKQLTCMWTFHGKFIVQCMLIDILFQGERVSSCSQVKWPYSYLVTVYIDMYQYTFRFFTLGCKCDWKKLSFMPQMRCHIVVNL